MRRTFFICASDVVIFLQRVDSCSDEPASDSTRGTEKPRTSQLARPVHQAKSQLETLPLSYDVRLGQLLLQRAASEGARSDPLLAGGLRFASWDARHEANHVTMNHVHP